MLKKQLCVFCQFETCRAVSRVKIWCFGDASILLTQTLLSLLTFLCHMDKKRWFWGTRWNGRCCGSSWEANLRELRMISALTSSLPQKTCPSTTGRFRSYSIEGFMVINREFLEFLSPYFWKTTLRFHHGLMFNSQRQKFMIFQEVTV